MQNLILKIKTKRYYFQEIRLYVWKIENFDELHPTTIEFNIFCLKFVQVSYLTMSTKGCLGLFLLCLDLELLKNLVPASV